MSESIIKQFGTIIEPLTNTTSDSVAGVVAEWINERIEVAKEVLEKENKNASRTLSQSIAPLPVVEEDGVIRVQVEANEYWDFVNSGVNGTEVNRGAPYSRKVNGSGDSSGYLSSILDWMRHRGITTSEYIDKTGAKRIKQLKTSKDFEGMAFGIMGAIKRKGQKATPFMGIAFSNEALEDLENRILKLWQ